MRIGDVYIQPRSGSLCPAYVEPFSTTEGWDLHIGGQDKALHVSTPYIARPISVRAQHQLPKEFKT